MRVKPFSIFTRSLEKENPIKQAKKIDNIPEYFMQLDSYNGGQTFPRQRDWYSLYEMPSNQKSDLANLTYLSFEYPIQYLALHKPTMVKKTLESFNTLLKTDNILSADEINTFLDKTAGHYSPSNLTKYSEKNFPDKETLNGNLKFIRTLLKSKNKPIFEKMDPDTLVGILYNRLVPHKHLESTLKNLKSDKVINYSDYEAKITIHESLLGQTYTKAKRGQIQEKNALCDYEMYINGFYKNN